MRAERKIVTITCDLCKQETGETVKRVDVYTGVEFRERDGAPSFSVMIDHPAFDPDICPACAEKILLDAVSRVTKGIFTDFGAPPSGEENGSN